MSGKKVTDIEIKEFHEYIRQWALKKCVKVGDSIDFF